MSQSLCVVLPVRNAQATLGASAAAILEALSELTGDFELLLLDNGSTDATPDVAQELADRFPQVRIARQGVPLNSAEIARAALTLTSAEQILLCDENCTLELADLHKLWPGRQDYDAVLAWPADANNQQKESYSQRLRAWRLKLSKPAAAEGALSAAGYQLLHRSVLERVRFHARDRYELLGELSRHGFRFQIVEVRTARKNAMSPISRPGEAMRVDGRSPAVAGPSHRRANRLEAIKGFALGE